MVNKKKENTEKIEERKIVEKDKKVGQILTELERERQKKTGAQWTEIEKKNGKK
jgi:hypothetical protein